MVGAGRSPACGVWLPLTVRTRQVTADQGKSLCVPWAAPPCWMGWARG